jgi:hypothetical protein
MENMQMWVSLIEDDFRKSMSEGNVKKALVISK